MINYLVWKKPEFPNIWRVRRPEREGNSLTLFPYCTVHFIPCSHIGDVSHYCSLGCPGTCSVGQSGLEFTEISLPLLGSKACNTTPSSFSFFMLSWQETDKCISLNLSHYSLFLNLRGGGDPRLEGKLAEVLVTWETNCVTTVWCAFFCVFGGGSSLWTWTPNRWRLCYQNSS